ncbi:MAG: TraM recognition domain-containing protein [Bdellovibrionales bacterium]
MPVILEKHQVPWRDMFRDVRPASVRTALYLRRPEILASLALGPAVLLIIGSPEFWAYADIMAIPMYFYFRWALNDKFALPFKIPAYANMPDPHNPPPGKSSPGKSAGILYLGNVFDKADDDHGREMWLTNVDARTHILFLGTTGSGKTEGLKALVANALCWGSGFSYTDGKADTDLWASLYSLARRFGRDDDILVLNYMTGNSDDGSMSNTMNPFSNGSASYLANLIVNLMPDAGGDNAMWKERAVALMFALMPALTFKRDKQGMLLDVGVVRDHLELQPIIRLSRDQTMPARIIHGLEGYLNTLPGYVAAAFDDEGNERPPSPDQPMYDLQVARQQHGYLSMQFTRSMQSLADEYGYIFKAQLADIDVLDVVLNRRIMVVLIPALEKSGDEAANLGKIVAACLKGMMGATLGNTVEGAWETAIGSKQTYSNSSFMTVFDEVGYYTAAGMAVMAAQARSLGFSLVFAAQDLPSMEKRVKQEAKSIVGNCNLKIIGRVEDPTDTKDFIERHGGQSWVMETKGFSSSLNSIGSLFMNTPYSDDRTAALNMRSRLNYDHLRGLHEGDAYLIFGDWIHKVQMFYSEPGKAKALRVHRLLPVPGVTKSTEARDRVALELESRLKDKEWTAAGTGGTLKEMPEITAMANAVKGAAKVNLSAIEMGVISIASIAKLPSGAKAADSAAAEKTDSPEYPQEDSYGSSGISASERANLPPLHEGDQYEIENVERQSYAAKNSPAFAGTDADLAAIVPSVGGDDDVDFSAVELPEKIKSFLAQSAKQINEGLRGKGDRK